MEALDAAEVGEKGRDFTVWKWWLYEIGTDFYGHDGESGLGRNDVFENTQCGKGCLVTESAV